MVAEEPQVPGMHRSRRRRPPARTVGTRHRLTPEAVAERFFIPEDSPEHRATTRLLELQKSASRDRAEQISVLSGLWQEPGDDEMMSLRQVGDEAAAVVLRTSIHRAGTMLRDAHLAVTDLSATLSRLGAGDLPAEWFDVLLRSTRDLTSARRQEVDRRVVSWQLADISTERFRSELRRLVLWLSREDPQKEPQQQRDVSLRLPAVPDGTATMAITGPVPEIMALWSRLDACTRAVQDQQRRAIDAGSPVPFDLDGDAAADGRPLSLTSLRYAVLTRTQLDTAGIEAPVDRFRMNVVVPVLTLMGLDDAPAMLDGMIPIPASSARLLAAEQPVWHRILTDPVDGAFLPVAAATYRPSTAMIEHLRLRDPQCAAPGCSRSTLRAAEADHIEEFHQDSPSRGGPTVLENLHLLCRTHHRLKTEGRIDPVRGPTGTTTWTIGIGNAARVVTTEEDRRDTASMETPYVLAVLERAQSRYLAAQDEARRNAEGTASRREEPPPF